MALTIEEQHETNDLDHDILATREVTLIYEDISACQKSWVNDRNDEHCGLSLSGSASERL